MKVYVVLYDMSNYHDPDANTQVYATLEQAQEALHEFVEEHCDPEYDAENISEFSANNGQHYCHILEKEVIEKGEPS